MKLQNKLALIFRCGLLVVSSTLMSGCFELNYPDIETLYTTLGTNVEVIKTDEKGLASSSDNVSIKEKLFNDDTVNDMDKAPMLDPAYYEYVVVKITKTMNIGDFALYVKSEQNVDFTIRIFISEVSPSATTVRPFNAQKGIGVPYSDDFKKPAAEQTLSVTDSNWASFYISTWNNEVDSKSVKIEANQYFIVQFLNNTGYGADIELLPAKFIPVNLMISPIKEK